jgi:hypothetical protein
VRWTEAGASLGNNVVIEFERAKSQLESHLARPGQGVETAPTAQRAGKAAALGENVTSRTNADGEVTWRISPALEELKRRGTLTAEEHRAAQQFLQDYFLGQYAGPKTSGYRERTSGSAADASDYEVRRVHHAREAQRAIQAVDKMYWPAIAWLMASLGDGLPLSALGAHYAPHLGAQTQSARGGQVLAFCCVLLCRHYGLQHRLNVQRRIDELSRIFLEDRTG